ncbi:Protoheme IX farnesyltransferase [Phytophthora citrophthora]|uniref:Protoheme IX farnesyltransferase, mitochondrial n=1 Tax=Phytophthora citrophthora TaxID=4793 RepID=A0AAD9G2M9_9STRA|nr:Protoheme IX farnesyltransferase [Phytophthora citrophthora]
MLTLASAPRARALLAATHRRPAFRVPPHVIRVLSTRPTAEVAAATTAKASATAVIDATNAQAASTLTLKDRLEIYSQLSKSRLSALVVMTTGAGFLMAGGPISWSTFAAATVGTSLAAASANTFNQCWEVELDAKMQRTQRRPLPSGRITRSHALAFGAATATASTAILAAGCSPLVASLGALNIGLYALVYTPMKMKSEYNTWVGSIVGAIPPIMGWAAATGTVLAPEAALHAYLMYCWQMPHFFALSWRSRKDYGRGGYKMVACNDPTGSRSAALALRYSYYMGAIPIVAALTDATSYMFAVEGTVVNAYTIYLAHKFYAKPNNATAQKVFLASLWYLPVIMGCMVLHSQQWMDDEEIESKKEASVWREAFLGEVENFQSQDPSAHFDESSMSAWLVNKVRAVRHSLRDFCIHESLWGVKDGQHNADESNVLCPVHVGHQAKETVAITAQASRKDL